MNTNKTNVPKVSVVVPVWNPGPGVLRCIESLRSQTLEDIEIIFVDDCGTDGAMETIRKAAAEDPRIRIIENEKNLGPGPSRNKGIETAKGEYLSFIDPDDYVETDFIEKLYKIAKAGGYDIVKGQVVYELCNGNTIRRSNDILRQQIEAGASLFNVFRSGHFSAIYRRRLLTESHACYGKTLNSEDSLFLLRACHAAKSMTLENMAIYHYVQRSDSLTNHFNKDRMRDQIDGLNELLRYLIERIDDTDQAALYAVRKLEYNLQVYIEARRTGEGTEYYLEELKEAIIRLPFLGRMKDISLPVKILVEDGKGLALRPVFQFKENGFAKAYVDIAKDWVDYACTHPSRMPLIRKKIYSIFRNAKRAVNEEQLSKVNRSCLKKELSEQRNRLPHIERYRMRVINSAYTLSQYLPNGISNTLKRLLIHS